jgi:hypothetical protein
VLVVVDGNQLCAFGGGHSSAVLALYAWAETAEHKDNMKIH